MRTTILSIFMILALAACEEQGPAEKAGEELDEAMQSIQRDAGEMREQVDDTVDQLREDVGDAAREAGEMAEDLEDEIESAPQ